MTRLELARSLRNNIFADRASLREAYDYASMIADSTDNPGAVYTALHVMMNTIAREVRDLEPV